MHAVIDHARNQFDEEISRLESRLASLRQARGRSMDRSPWLAVVNALKLAPMNAGLDVEVADAPEPADPPAPPPTLVSPFVDRIRYMRPKGDEGPELVLTSAEAAAYDRLQRQAAQAGMTAAEREAVELQKARMFTHMVAARQGGG
jgi:hypothetical protein